MDALLALAKTFSDKVTQTTGTSNNESSIKLSTSEYKINSESKKDGYVFNLKFS